VRGKVQGVTLTIVRQQEKEIFTYFYTYERKGKEKRTAEESEEF